MSFDYNVRRPKSVYHPSEDKLPVGFTFPASYLDYVKKEEVDDLHPWVLLCHDGKEGYDDWLETLKAMYPSRQLVPFADWLLDDDMACFEMSDDPDNPRIHYIHTYASPGWEERGECDSFDEWLKISRNEAKEYQIDKAEEVLQRSLTTIEQHMDVINKDTETRGVDFAPYQPAWVNELRKLLTDKLYPEFLEKYAKFTFDAKVILPSNDINVMWTIGSYMGMENATYMRLKSYEEAHSEGYEMLETWHSDKKFPYGIY